MKLKYFTESSYTKLYDDISNNIESYKQEDGAWLQSYFGNSSVYKESKIDAVLPSLSAEYGDLVNTRMIFDALKDKLSPKQASNPYLWAYMTHFEYWNYTIQRHFTSKSGETKDRISAETIKRRFFCNTAEGNRIGFLRNSIARLWWAGYLTYQEDEKNHYELTEVLLSHSDIQMQLIERNYSMNKEVTIGILKAVKMINDNPDIPNLAISTEWRDLCKFINRYGAVTLLDTLDRNDVCDLAYNYILSLRK